MVYSEPELIRPALVEINKSINGLTTSQLIDKLRERLQPDGHDIEIIAGRNDDYFSQKVRNLKSHDTLTIRGLSDYQNGIWKITERGKEYIGIEEQDDKDDIAISLEAQGFNKDNINLLLEEDYNNIIIEEGAPAIRSITQRKRSNKLREEAVKIHRVKNNGKLPCVGCGFDFEEKYGERGKDFIEIHHKDMISEMDILGVSQQLEEALNKIIPLCSNCHKMVHRKRGEMLSIEELRSIIKD